MVNFIVRGVKWGYRRTKKHDMFKQSISMTYKGNESISTWVGTLATLIIISISAFYFVTLLMRMFKYTEISWNQNERPIGLETDTLNLDFNEAGFDIIWIIPKFNANLDEAMDVTNMNILAIDEGKRSRIMDWFGKKENFDPTNEYIYLIKFCTDIGVKEIKGSQETNSVVNSIHFEFSPWKYSSDSNNFNSSWGISNYLRNIVDNTPIRFNFTSSVVDLSSMESPIKNVSQPQTLFYRFGVNQNYLLTATKIELYLEDSLFPILYEDSFKTFYSFSLTKEGEYASVDDSQELVDGQISIIVTLNSKVLQYKRRVLNFFDVLGTVGGVFEILEVTLGFFVGIISYTLVKKEVKLSLHTADLRYQQIKRAYEKMSKIENQWACKCRWRNISAGEENKDQLDSHPNNLNERHPNKIYYGKDKTEFIGFKNTDPLNYDTLKDELNCIEIIYSIKELRQQVNYLLSKDPNYIKESKTNKTLRLSPTSINRFTKPFELSSRMENYNVEEVEHEEISPTRSQNRMSRRRVLPNMQSLSHLQMRNHRQNNVSETQNLVRPISQFPKNQHGDNT